MDTERRREELERTAAQITSEEELEQLIDRAAEENGDGGLKPFAPILRGLTTFPPEAVTRLVTGAGVDPLLENPNANPAALAPVVGYWATAMEAGEEWAVDYSFIPYRLRDLAEVGWVSAAQPELRPVLQAGTDGDAERRIRLGCYEVLLHLRDLPKRDLLTMATDLPFLGYSARIAEHPQADAAVWEALADRDGSPHLARCLSAIPEARQVPAVRARIARHAKTHPEILANLLADVRGRPFEHGFAVLADRSPETAATFLAELTPAPDQAVPNDVVVRLLEAESSAVRTTTLTALSRVNAGPLSSHRGNQTPTRRPG